MALFAGVFNTCTLYSSLCPASSLESTRGFSPTTSHHSLSRCLRLPSSYAFHFIFPHLFTTLMIIHNSLPLPLLAQNVLFLEILPTYSPTLMTASTDGHRSAYSFLFYRFSPFFGSVLQRKPAYAGFSARANILCRIVFGYLEFSGAILGFCDEMSGFLRMACGGTA